jgi:ribosome-associated translation inhibitor RaiA
MEMSEVRITAVGDISRKQVEEARERIASLEQYTRKPPVSIRLTLRRGPGRSRNPYVADASALFDGRILAAHTTGPTPAEAAEAAADRLRRQLRRTVGAEVAQRNEPAAIQEALADLEGDRAHRPKARLKPPDEREIVHRRSYADHPMTTLEAAADLLDLDQDFYLFRHAVTGEDVVIYRRDDGRIGLLYPAGSALADEGDDVVVAEVSRYSSPLTIAAARSEMDVLNHRFLYFIDAGDGRGKAIYLRHDGDYGIVEPE